MKILAAAGCTGHGADGRASSVQQTPEAILELRRILHVHLEEL